MASESYETRQTDPNGNCNRNKLKAITGCDLLLLFHHRYFTTGLFKCWRWEMRDALDVMVAIATSVVDFWSMSFISRKTDTQYGRHAASAIVIICFRIAGFGYRPLRHYIHTAFRAAILWSIFTWYPLNSGRVSPRCGCWPISNLNGCFFAPLPQVAYWRQ